MNASLEWLPSQDNQITFKYGLDIDLPSFDTEINSDDLRI